MIASRRSLLARRQAEQIGAALGRLNPHVEVQYLWLDSEGDRPREPAPDAGGDGPNGPGAVPPLGKGLFVRAIEQALIEDRADIAVHSLKDLPAVAGAEGLMIAAIPPRVDPRDCLISRAGAASITELAPGAVVGTASLRRAAQLRRLRSDLVMRQIRGNIETRIRRVLEEGAYDATLLAVAGLVRADLAEHAVQPIDPSIMLPAPGQGALAVQCRADDHATVRRCLPLNDAPTASAVNAERQVVAALNCDCHAPIAVFAQPEPDGGGTTLRLRVRLLSPDGSRCLEADEQASVKTLAKLTRRVVDQLRRQGAQALLAEVARAAEAAGS